MDKKPKVAFVWLGIHGMYGQWKDGLWKAIKIVEETYDVECFDPSENIPKDSIVLYWESPCTHDNKENGPLYKKIKNLPNKKALLFSGGPIKKEWLDGFDHVFVESKINGDELTDLGIKHSTAFGINEEIFRPMLVSKKWWGIHAGTCASWKRQGFVGEALGKDGIVVGREQPNGTDTFGFDRCRELGATVLPEQKPEKLAELVNQAHVCVQTAAFWGGGQRATLEAMACNVPVVSMSDSPKNSEYVEESGFGFVVDPDPEKIRKAVILAMSEDWGTRGRQYILSKWTAKHYADSLLDWIQKQ